MSITPEIYAATSGHVQVVAVTNNNKEALEDWSSQLRYHAPTNSLELKLRLDQRFPNGPDSLFLEEGDSIARYENGRVDMLTPFELQRLFRKVNPEELAGPLIVLEAERKPNPIKAVRFYVENGEELARWCGGTLGWVRTREVRELTIMLRPDEALSDGDIRLGEYVVQEANGTFRRCTDEEFNREYNVLNNEE